MVKRWLCRCPVCDGGVVEGLVYGPDETFDDVLSVTAATNLALSRAGARIDKRNRIEKARLRRLVRKVEE
jgi:hypothetical protein